MTQLQLAIQLFLQLTLILLVCRSIGWVGRRFFGQTQVVMEMVAGVLLGPSLFGLLAPMLQGQLFPLQIAVEGAAGVTVGHPSMTVLYALSQIGLVLFMFLIGLELNVDHLRGQVKSAGVISGVGILVPLMLGGGLGIWMLSRERLFTDQVGPFSAALYVGSSMAVTAFPVLARILHERGIASTRLGTMILAAGSINDTLAWCLLAVVLASLKGSPTGALLTIGGGLLYGFLTLRYGRRLLKTFATVFERTGQLGPDAFTAVLVVIMLSALITDSIGMHSVFGAFIAGAAMPRGAFAKAVAERVEPLTVSLLIPMFFVFSGLNTHVALVDTLELWLLAAVVIAVAIVAKGVACALAARWSGESWRDALAIGTLMNARGVMELILLNIGLEHGVITPTLFTILVLMAVVTTLMASPLYGLISRLPAAEPMVALAVPAGSS